MTNSLIQKREQKEKKFNEENRKVKFHPNKEFKDKINCRLAPRVFWISITKKSIPPQPNLQGTITQASIVAKKEEKNLKSPNLGLKKNREDFGFPFPWIVTHTSGSHISTEYFSSRQEQDFKKPIRSINDHNTPDRRNSRFFQQNNADSVETLNIYRRIHRHDQSNKRNPKKE